MSSGARKLRESARMTVPFELIGGKPRDRGAHALRRPAERGSEGWPALAQRLARATGVRGHRHPDGCPGWRRCGKTPRGPVVRPGQPERLTVNLTITIVAALCQ